MRLLSLLAFCMALAACATTQNLAVSSDTLASMQDSSLVIVHRESPDFVAMTSGKGMFAVAGVGAAVVAGNKIVRENGVVDPAKDISRALARNLVRDYGLRMQGEAELAGSNDIEGFASGSDYALEVATKGWSYIYDGFKFGDYFVGYSTDLRLIEVSTGEVVSSGTCAYDAKKAGKSPVSHETLLADDAAYIKQELKAAADHCMQQFAADLFPAASVAGTYSDE